MLCMKITLFMKLLLDLFEEEIFIEHEFHSSKKY